MQVKQVRMVNIAAAAGLLLTVSLGALVVYWQFSGPSQPDAVSTTLPATAPSALSRFVETHRFFHLVESDETQQVADMLARNPSLAKEIRAEDGVTPLHLALSIAMAKLLLDDGA